jgi:hypothetical protein
MFSQLTHPPSTTNKSPALTRFDPQMQIMLKHANLLQDNTKVIKLVCGLRPLKLLD